MPIVPDAGVFEIVFVTAGAVRGRTGLRPSASPNVLAVSNRLKVIGVDAAAITAEVVKFKPFRNGANEYLVEGAMRHSTPSAAPG